MVFSEPLTGKKMKPKRYHPLQAALHWISAALIVFSVMMGTLYLKHLPNTAQKVVPLRVHLIIGLLVGLLTLVRLVSASLLPQPEPATAGNGFFTWLAAFVRTGLYVAVLGMVLSGIVVTLHKNFPETLQFGMDAPLPHAVWHSFRVAHTVFSYALMALTGVHVAAALFHQFIRKDQLLLRMWPVRPR
jgi:cytochrome b561